MTAVSSAVREGAHTLLDSALTETDPLRAQHCRGAFLGYAVAAGLAERELLDDARRMPFAKAVTFEEMYRPTWCDDDLANLARACGIRWGYKRAIAEDLDAAECATCGEGLLDADHPTICPNDGTALCDLEDCHSLFHGGRGCPADDTWEQFRADMDRDDR